MYSNKEACVVLENICKFSRFKTGLGEIDSYKARLSSLLKELQKKPKRSNFYSVGIDTDILNALVSRLALSKYYDLHVYEIIMSMILSETVDRYFIWNAARFNAWKCCRYAMTDYFWPQIFEYMHWEMNDPNLTKFGSVEHRIIKRMYLYSFNEEHLAIQFNRDKLIADAVEPEEKVYLERLLHILDNKQNIQVTHKIHISH